MFVVKIFKSKQLLDVKHYKVFQNAVADIGNKNIFDNVCDELIDTLGNLKIHCLSQSEKTGIADDFEFRYSNGITIYIGEISTVDNYKQI